MPDTIQFDVAVANRFMSSLSKSLQALCHGCMDFDNGIEICGYINVNVDSGSKVDYVLNEKVLKSTNNSMTFVSNSFLAKKEQNKQTRDESCSPIPELAVPAPHPQSRRDGPRPHPGYSNPRFSQFASHSHVLHGPQKRPWGGGDWRHSQRKHARATSSAFQSYQNQTTPYTESYSSSQSYPNVASDSSLQANNSSHAQPSVTSSDISTGIKKEIVENDETQSQQTNTDFDTNNTANIPIKSDPDAEPVTSAAESKAEGEGDSENAQQPAETMSFFEQPESKALTKEEDTSYSEAPADAEEDGVDSTDAQAQPSAEMHDSSSGVPLSDSQPQMEQGYSEAGEDSYAQSAYADEGSSSNQFEVIEIDDEDEDVQAMFQDQQWGKGPSSWFPWQRGGTRSTVSEESDGNFEGTLSQDVPLSSACVQEQSSEFYSVLDNHDSTAAYQCHICNVNQLNQICFQKHMNTLHRSHCALPYICPLCQMGFFTYSGRRKHCLTHSQGRQFVCSICDSKFLYKHHLKRHFERKHKLHCCGYCLQLFEDRDEFNSHVTSCSTTRLYI